MAYGHTPHPPFFFPMSCEFCPSDNAKTAWSISDCIIMHYTVSSSFKHHPIPDGLIVVSDGVDFQKRFIQRAKFSSSPNIVAN